MQTLSPAGFADYRVAAECEVSTRWCYEERQPVYRTGQNEGMQVLDLELQQLQCQLVGAM